MVAFLTPILGSLMGSAPAWLGVASLVGSGVSTMMSLRAQKQAYAYEQIQARTIEKQYKDEAEAVTLAMQQQELERKRRYFQNVSENRALLAGTGVSLDSPSYRALFKANKKYYKQDMSNLSLSANEQRLSSLRQAQQSRLTGRAAKESYKSGVATTLGRSFLNTASTLNEFNFNKLKDGSS